MNDNSVLRFNIQFHAAKAKTASKFKLNKGDYKRLRDFLNINWDEVLDVPNTNIDVMWERFKMILLNGIVVDVGLDAPAAELSVDTLSI